MALIIFLALLGSIGLDAAGLGIPIIRALISFIYLSFIPGITILRILRLNEIGKIETIVYSVGLSLATLMFIGAFINTLYPSLGISRPISIIPLVITIGIIQLILCVLCYIRNKDHNVSIFIISKHSISSPVVFLCLIPFLAIFGTYFVNFYHNESIVMILIFLIAIVAIFVGFDVFIPKKLYPLAIFMIAVSLMFHNSLITMYIWGWDVQYERQLADLVRISGIWDSALPTNSNGMLSIIMLAPIYSIISNISSIWVFKIIYPVLFSFVPLCLYRIYQNETDDNTSFISCFFFMSIYTFFAEMFQLGRQEIAEIFFALLILLMVEKDIDKVSRSILLIIFGFSLSVSHYGLSYIFMASLIAVWAILYSLENTKLHSILNKFLVSTKTRDCLTTNLRYLTTKNRKISSTFVLLFITFTLTWYLSISNSSAFESLARICNQVVGSISSDFLDPEASQGLKLITAQPLPGLLHEINRILNYLNQIFIVIGGLVILFKNQEMKLKKEFVVFSIINLGICIAGVFVPYFASQINMSRLYQITLFFLAPVCIIGGIAVVKLFIKVFKVSQKDRYLQLPIKILSIYFAVFLAYQTGLIFQVTEGRSGSLSLDSSIDYPSFNDRDVSGALWLNDVRGNKYTYADSNRRLLLVGYLWDRLSSTPAKASYIYLGTFNSKNNSLTKSIRLRANTETSNENYSPLIIGRNKVYTNGGALVYYL